MKHQFTNEQIFSFMEKKGIGPDKLRAISLSERMKIKAQLLSEMTNEFQKAHDRNLKNAKRRARYYRIKIADRPCVCFECGQTKTYKEMAIANIRSPKHEDNVCETCLENEYPDHEIFEEDFEEYE